MLRASPAHWPRTLTWREPGPSLGRWRGIWYDLGLALHPAAARRVQNAASLRTTQEVATAGDRPNGRDGLAAAAADACTWLRPHSFLVDALIWSEHPGSRGRDPSIAAKGESGLPAGADVMGRILALCAAGSR